MSLEVNLMGIKIRHKFSLDLHWPTSNPFLFCAHHKDNYPQGNGRFGPSSELLKGRNIGNDFVARDGWRMYHGAVVPGFPVHPHRGFETVTVVLEGLIDHSDSHGAAGRYGAGDIQWMTAGRGMQHAEMFPLVHENKPNPAELFQIWLNLPAKNKMVEPHYKMLWSEDVPVIATRNERGALKQIRLIAGSFESRMALAPAPDSWASNPNNNVRILLIRLDPGQHLEIDAVSASLSRNLYLYVGNQVDIQAEDQSESLQLENNQGVSLDGHSAFSFINSGVNTIDMLLLEGEPIMEPIVQYGPFVMNTQEEISKAFQDFRQTGFGGWPWDRPDPVHGSEARRFARYADGQSETR
jgi:redox-sensitive bicupin YhaK (pirin superfamily)